MCLACGDGTASGLHAVGLTERPAHRLCGVYWEGTYDDAAAGATRSVIERVSRWSAARTVLWRSPIVGISWNDRPDGFRYFAGIAPELGEAVPDEYAMLDLPEMRFASSWHGEGDGGVAEHYGRVLDWVRAQGLVWDKSLLHLREEYPDNVDLARAPALRLLVPVRENG